MCPPDIPTRYDNKLWLTPRLRRVAYSFPLDPKHAKKIPYWPEILTFAFGAMQTEGGFVPAVWQTLINFLQEARLGSETAIFGSDSLRSATDDVESHIDTERLKIGPWSPGWHVVTF